MLTLENKKPGVFRAVAVYEDIPHAYRAFEVCHLVNCKLGSEFNFELEAWRFEEILDFDVRDNAAAAAMEAPLVIIAASGKEDLPLLLKTWICDWTRRRNQRLGALVSLLDTDDPMIGGGSVAYGFLKESALCAHMKFFASVNSLDQYVQTRGTQTWREQLYSRRSDRVCHAPLSTEQGSFRIMEARECKPLETI